MTFCHPRTDSITAAPVCASLALQCLRTRLSPPCAPTVPGTPLRAPWVLRADIWRATTAVPIGCWRRRPCAGASRLSSTSSHPQPSRKFALRRCNSSGNSAGLTVRHKPTAPLLIGLSMKLPHQRARSSAHWSPPRNLGTVKQRPKGHAQEQPYDSACGPWTELQAERGTTFD